MTIREVGLFRITIELGGMDVDRQYLGSSTKNKGSENCSPALCMCTSEGIKVAKYQIVGRISMGSFGKNSKVRGCRSCASKVVVSVRTGKFSASSRATCCVCAFIDDGNMRLWSLFDAILSVGCVMS